MLSSVNAAAAAVLWSSETPSVRHPWVSHGFLIPGAALAAVPRAKTLLSQLLLAVALCRAHQVPVLLPPLPLHRSSAAVPAAALQCPRS